MQALPADASGERVKIFFNFFCKSSCIFKRHMIYYIG